MPFPFLIVAAALAGGALVKVAKTALRDELARNGYCTWCGRTGWHSFHQDGLTWKKVGPIAVLTGGIGTAIAGLVSRNVYRCGWCGKLTLPCRCPGCSGMARSTDVYDYEFCGHCVDGNNVHAERAKKEHTEAENNKLLELLRVHEERIRALEAEMHKHAGDTERIVNLMKVIARDRETINHLRRVLGLQLAESSA